MQILIFGSIGLQMSAIFPTHARALVAEEVAFAARV